MTLKKYLTTMVLISMTLSVSIIPALAYDPLSKPDDSVDLDWAGAEPMYDPIWPSADPTPCDGINHFDDKHDSVYYGIAVPDTLRGFGPWIPSTNMMVKRIELIFRNGPWTLSLGIYSDDGGTPGEPLSVLAYTKYFQTSSEAGWYGADLITPLAVTAGTKYWIVMHCVDETTHGGGIWYPLPPYIYTTNYLSSVGDITGGASWESDSSDFGYKVRIFCEPPVGGSLQPMENSFDIIRWAMIPMIAFIALTVYTTNLRKTRLFQ